MDKDYPNASRMYTVMEMNHKTIVSMPQIDDYIIKEYPEVEKAATVEFVGKIFFETDPEHPEKKCMLNMMEITPAFIDFFSVKFINQPLTNYESSPNGIILTQSTALKIFGTTDVNGKKIVAVRSIEDEKHSYTVCGVIDDFQPISYFNMHGGKTDALFLNDVLGNFNPNQSISRTSATTMIMLHKNVSLKQFNKKFLNFSPPAYNPLISDIMKRNQGGFYLSPLSNVMAESMGALFYVVIGIFGGIGALVLSVSIFNYTSYSINLFLNKQHECAIRKSVSAGKWHLFFLLFTEIAITIILSGLLATCWVNLLGSYIAGLFGSLFVLDTNSIYFQLVQYILIGLVMAFLLCLIPAGKINRMSVKDTIFGGKSKNPKSKSRNILLGLQLFLSALFISCSLFLYLQLNHISSIMVGTLTKAEKENIIEISLMDDALIHYSGNILQKLRENPHIEDIFLSQASLVSRGNTITSLRYGEKEIDIFKMNYMPVGYNYFDFIHLQAIEGRLWKEGESDAIVISKKAKALLEDEDVLGKVFSNYERSYTIVGVVEDIVSREPYEEGKATFYFPVKDDRHCFIYVRVNPEKKKECLDYINQTIRAYLYEVSEFSSPSLSESISEITKIEGILFKIIILFSIVSLTISLSGVYAVVTLTTKRRRKEVAIRKINGATLPGIIRLFLRTYLFILLIAAIPAFTIIYFAINKWLEMYAYRISVSWIVFTLIFIGLAALLTFTIIYQLIKVARTNPAEVIKSE